MQARKPTSSVGVKGKYGTAVKAMGKTKTDYINNTKNLKPTPTSSVMGKSPLSSNTQHIKFSSKPRDFTPVRGGKITQSWNDGTPISLSLSASRIDGYSEMHYDNDDGIENDLGIQEVAMRGSNQQLL
jgi:hypothetical protein